MVASHGRQFPLCMMLLLREKSDLKNMMRGLIKHLKASYNIQVQYLHCDNTGENIDFKWTCQLEKMRMKLKYTTLGTPQQNDQVKQKFATLFNWVHAMFNGRKFTTFFRNDLWAKASTQPCFSTIISSFPIEMEREREASCFCFKNLVNCISPHT